MAEKVIVRSRFDDRNRVMAVIEGKSLTEQSHGHECNINTIVAKAIRTGQVPLQSGSPLYGDFSTVGDYQTAHNAVLAAQAAFTALPATIRKRFNNDPAQAILFLENLDNRDEAVKLGLVNPAVASPVEPAKADAVSPESSPAVS